MKRFLLTITIILAVPCYATAQEYLDDSAALAHALYQTFDANLTVDKIAHSTKKNQPAIKTPSALFLALQQQFLEELEALEQKPSSSPHSIEPYALFNDKPRKEAFSQTLKSGQSLAISKLAPEERPYAQFILAYAMLVADPQQTQGWKKLAEAQKMAQTPWLKEMITILQTYAGKPTAQETVKNPAFPMLQACAQARAYFVAKAFDEALGELKIFDVDALPCTALFPYYHAIWSVHTTLTRDALQQNLENIELRLPPKTVHALLAYYRELKTELPQPVYFELSYYLAQNLQNGEGIDPQNREHQALIESLLKSSAELPHEERARACLQTLLITPEKIHHSAAFTKGLSACLGFLEELHRDDDQLALYQLLYHFNPQVFAPEHIMRYMLTLFHAKRIYEVKHVMEHYNPQNLPLNPVRETLREALQTHGRTLFGTLLNKDQIYCLEPIKKPQNALNWLTFAAEHPKVAQDILAARVLATLELCAMDLLPEALLALHDESGHLSNVVNLIQWVMAYLDEHAYTQTLQEIVLSLHKLSDRSLANWQNHQLEWLHPRMVKMGYHVLRSSHAPEKMLDTNNEWLRLFPHAKNNDSLHFVTALLYVKAKNLPNAQKHFAHITQNYQHSPYAARAIQLAVEYASTADEKRALQEIQEIKFPTSMMKNAW